MKSGRAQVEIIALSEERPPRRALAEAKAAWRAKHALEGRVFWPWVSEPGSGCCVTPARRGPSERRRCSTPDLVCLAAHYRFSPRTTERQDPESKARSRPSFASRSQISPL